MYKKFLISIIFFDLVLCSFFASWSAFYSIHLAFLANICIPYITYLNIKKRIPKFVKATKSRIFIQNPIPLEEPSKKISFKSFKYFGVFMNIYKFFAYFIFAILVIALINKNLFHPIAFFVASFIISANLIIIRVLNAKNT